MIRIIGGAAALLLTFPACIGIYAYADEVRDDLSQVEADTIAAINDEYPVDPRHNMTLDELVADGMLEVTEVYPVHMTQEQLDTTNSSLDHIREMNDLYPLLATDDTQAETAQPRPQLPKTGS